MNRSPLGEALLLVLTMAVPWITVLPGGRWLLPWVAPLTLYPGFARCVHAGRPWSAWGRALAWAALLSLGVIVLAVFSPETASRGILRGTSYRQEMFSWIETGQGAEGDWRLFLPTHLQHLALFCLAAVVSAGYLGLVLGAFLLDYMSYFVGSYAAASGHPLIGALIAWVPWSVLRVAAFILLGVLLARPLLVRRIWPYRRSDLHLVLIAAGGILLDLLLKGLAAPAYGRFLARFAGDLPS